MKRDNNFKVLAIIAICVAVVGLSLGYAALSQTLNIKTTATVQSSASSWSVKFPGPCTCTATGVATAGNCSVTDTTITTSGTILKAPGDAVTCSFSVKNGGDVSAKLSTITNLTPTIKDAANSTTSADVTTVKNNYTYAISYADGTALAANDALDAGASKNLKLVITYKADATALPTTDVSISNLGATLVYVQK